jgi:hypothetical protein
MDSEIIKERERIKAIIERKLSEFVEYRKKKHRRHTFESTFNKLNEDIIFLIDNPDYVKLKDRVPESSIPPLIHARES